MQPTQPSDANVIAVLNQELQQAHGNRIWLLAKVADLEAENARLRETLASLDATPKEE